jgi:DNA-binding transcriptional MerR regulator
MFSQRHEQELAEIKSMTQELGIRLQEVVDQLERVKEAQQLEAAQRSSGPADGPELDQAPKAGKQRKQQRRAKEAPEDGEARARRARKAAKRARAGEEAQADLGNHTSTAATNAAQPTNGASGGDAPTPQVAAGRGKKAKRSRATKPVDSFSAAGTAPESA